MTMRNEKKKRLTQIRWLSISMVIAVTTLMLEYLVTQFPLFIYTAVGLVVLGLTLISLIISRVVLSRPRFYRRTKR